MATNKNIDIDKAHVCILTIRQDEYDAVIRQTKPEGIAQKKLDYQISSINTISSGRRQVAVAQCTSSGPLSAQDAVNQILKDLRPDWIFLVGIAGGVPSEDFTLGDVICVTHVHDFGISAHHPDEVSYDVRGGPMHRDVLKMLKRLKAIGFRDWNTVEHIGKPRPCVLTPVAVEDSRLDGDQSWCSRTAESLNYHFNSERRDRQPDFERRPCGSSGSYVRDPNLVSKWVKMARSIAIFEMELAGAYNAIEADGNTRLLAIRGISDIVGLKRESAWTEFACHSAAAFALHLIISGIPFLYHDNSRIGSDSSHVNQASLPRPRESDNQHEESYGVQTNSRVQTNLRQPNLGNSHITLTINLDKFRGKKRKRLFRLFGEIIQLDPQYIQLIKTELISK